MTHPPLPSIVDRAVGDTTYTGDTDSPRMMLHAASLTLPFSPKKVRCGVVWCGVGGLTD